MQSPFVQKFWLDERPTCALREQINTHTHTHTILEVTVDTVFSSGLKQINHSCVYKECTEIPEHSVICQHELNFIDVT